MSYIQDYSNYVYGFKRNNTKEHRPIERKRIFLNPQLATLTGPFGIGGNEPPNRRHFCL